MIKILKAIVVFLMLNQTCLAQQKVYNPVNKNVSIRFEKDTFDFGTLIQGDSIHYDFIFKNTGSEPLVVRNAHGSCGCTIPSFQADSVLPGNTGKISVTFNSKGKSGLQLQVVNIFSNSPQSPTVLHITGFVKPDPVKMPHNE